MYLQIYKNFNITRRNPIHHGITIVQTICLSNCEIAKTWNSSKKKKLAKLKVLEQISWLKI